MDFRLSDTSHASGTELAHLVVDQSLSLSTSQPSSSVSTPAPSTSTNSTASTSASSKAAAAAARNKRFVCSHPGCDKTFSTSGHLARHIRVHTGEKAFQCTFPQCESKFSRHDNMLQHYRNHIVRNARRRKKAFAMAVATGTVGITDNIPYDDATPGSSKTRSESGAPIFVHSTYSSLSQAVPEMDSTHNPQAHHQPHSDLLSSNELLASYGGPSSGRGASASPVLGSKFLPSSSSSAPRPTFLNLSSLHPKDTFFTGPLTTSSIPYSRHGPPLASPSIMDRPHTATTSFFPVNLGGLGEDVKVTASHPPPLIQRHSYSALGSQHVLEPMTPTSDLPHYPYHQYPTSPGPIDPRDVYSPSLTASPQLIGASVPTPKSEFGTYYQPMQGSRPQLLQDPYGQSLALQGVPSIPYGVDHSHPHSQSTPTYFAHPHTSTSVIPRQPASHPSLGSHVNVSAELDPGEDFSLSISSRSTSIGSSTAHHLATSVDALAFEGTQYATYPSSSAPTANWLRSPGASLEHHDRQRHQQQLHSGSHPPHGHTYVHGHGHVWQPQSSAIGPPIPADAAAIAERAYRSTLPADQGHSFQEQHSWNSNQDGL